MPNTSPSGQGSTPAAALRAEAALWKAEADAIRAAMKSISSDVVTGRESNVDGKSDSDSKAQAAVSAALQRATASLALAEAAYVSRMASADAWENHTHPYVDNT
jgi:hypothetical protein